MLHLLGVWEDSNMLHGGHCHSIMPTNNLELITLLFPCHLNSIHGYISHCQSLSLRKRDINYYPRLSRHTQTEPKHTSMYPIPSQPKRCQHQSNHHIHIKAAPSKKEEPRHSAPAQAVAQHQSECFLGRRSIYCYQKRHKKHHRGD